MVNCRLRLLTSCNLVTTLKTTNLSSFFPYFRNPDILLPWWYDVTLLSNSQPTFCQLDY